MLLPIVAALAFGTQEALKAVSYRWRTLPLGTTSVVAVALPAKDTQAIVATGEAGYVVKDPNHPARIPMDWVTGVAVGLYTPDLIVAVGKANDRDNLRFSVDGGHSWRPGPTSPKREGGNIILSPDGRIWVWTGLEGGIRSEDDGFAWTPCEGLPGGVSVVADPTSFRRFYALVGGRLLVSDDGARSFDEQDLALTGLEPDDSPQAIVPAPGRAGDRWLLTRRTLYRSLPGKPFVRVPGVTDPRALGFGRPRHSAYPGNLPPTLFVAATIEGRTGMFRSDDEAVGWSLMEGAPSVSSVAGLTGDPKRYGVLYVSLADGRLLVGEPSR